MVDIKAMLFWLLITVFIPKYNACNQEVCASVVSKCMLTQSCNCDLEICSCCKECFNCLSYLYSECCSCIDMCPKPNETRSEISKKSHVEDLDGIPGLFKALTDDPDEENKWSMYTFPVDFDTAHYGAKLDTDLKFYLHSIDQKIDVTVKDHEKIITYNCTVIYMSQCLSWNKCKTNCQSMGATSYRWFHDGCCECVGSTCINYGINDSRCTFCPEPDESELDLDELLEEDELDYGEDDLLYEDD